MLEPVWCKNNKWITVNNNTIKGKRKWIIKNRFKVGLSTENPPHNQITKSFPK